MTNELVDNPEPRTIAHATKSTKGLQSHAEAFAKLARQTERLKAKNSYFRELFRNQAPGRYGRVTVSVVKSHQVKGYWREAHARVRVN